MGYILGSWPVELPIVQEKICTRQLILMMIYKSAVWLFFQDELHFTE
jgi:hypothetical protein